ncbi:MAG: NADH:flavin oxidoreductase/NADH oxidase family protein [Rothia sp. (in: high G+C Gram-positive bacteria)]|uniref:NADH:flavin oxidoreductase/NADH oxidase family protein n=1 Tax=Rothia sp. (in: high G+C Gram-positive bacteria) TaxID=1885016 RepID=UPI0026E05674|nr:NADH:flavin oxidoreductase/NADH oxidase family protein [Rothia sp. (in: high G+C Gram-positive bacteria)]MDO5750009.1 NADH:flavin oxidoreductase/NADH oxidase family protein [Rothia sp. (in: high G+C Gram-positive bacteria)]
MTTIFTPFTTVSGVTLPNRLVKAAMAEDMAGGRMLPTNDIITLYRAWAEGGTGLLITGHIMVDPAALSDPSDIAIVGQKNLTPFKLWADAVHAGGAKLMAQINHPGRQVQSNMPGEPIAPSAIAVQLGSRRGLFSTPRPMTDNDIERTIENFADTASLLAQSGFDGVEIHAAHGYLLSQFLSPLTNQRADRWGGSLENRARMLVEIVRRVRERVPEQFMVAVKLNSADFQRGGFEPEDAKKVIEMLAPLGVDFVELSGGSYESPATTGRSADERTMAREAYFLEMVADMVQTSPLPLMLTGGVRRMPVAQQVIDSGIALVGMATALGAVPDLPKHWARGEENAVASMPEIKIKSKLVASLASLARVRFQFKRIARAKKTIPGVPPLLAVAREQALYALALRRYSAWYRKNVR